MVLVSGLIFSGCSKPAATTAPAQTTAPATTVKTTSPAATPKPQPVSGGTLRIIIASTPSNLGDPGSTGRSPYVGVWSYVESLVLFDTKGNVVPWLAPYDPYLTDVLNILAKPSLTHFLGTDVLGRDTLSRLIYGARTALTVGILTVTIGTSIGIILGLIAGYFGGAVSMVIMRLMDMLLSFPMLLLALLIASLLGGGIHNVIIALTIGTHCSL